MIDLKFKCIKTLLILTIFIINNIIDIDNMFCLTDLLIDQTIKTSFDIVNKYFIRLFLLTQTLIKTNKIYEIYFETNFSNIII